MKVLIDTNVILDVLYKREGFYEDSLKIWKLCETRKIDGYISALSIPNIVYILRRELDPEKTLEVINNINLVFKIYDLKSEIIMQAAEKKTKDYEDALQMVTAQKLKASFIVTRNIKDFTGSKIIAVKPSELLERVDF
ncbi:MAG: PIN domain-containing protein [Anaeroplasma sp.]|uniref:type II toxin-antitoxin system VapC family toxin n=1 Tax=Anaeroplasma sp. TaxID=1872523 RepID=UPI002A90A857|nr:PIN domain-containing protein [Anaeroplasma sp.]MDY5982440.1 PIN domain-containing protein [Anaeroplasma sp.]